MTWAQWARGAVATACGGIVSSGTQYISQTAGFTFDTHLHGLLAWCVFGALIGILGWSSTKYMPFGPDDEPDV